MSKTFRPWKIDEPLFLPPTVADFVTPDHLARFVLSLVREAIDLTKITGTYGSERGQPPFAPTMMTVLLLYAYCCGIYSSRRIAKACRERVDFMSIVGLDAPDFRTISDFRKRHLKALGELFKQVLHLCERAGLVGFGHVALDGTKIKANASKHKAMSYARMITAEAELATEIAAWLERAAAADAAEDAQYGDDRRGDEPPDWMRDKQRRLDKIRAAKAALETEAKAAAEAQAALPQRYRGGRKPKHPPGLPKPTAQRNFTDPDSRIMIGRDGFIQAYNAQAAVDGQQQIILAHRLSNNPDDHAALVPLVAAAQANTGRKPTEISGDAGFCSEANLAELAAGNIAAYLATGRASHPAGAAAAPKGGPLVQAMRAKLKRAGHRSRYRLRKQIVEPVFGQIKQARGFRQFLLRGI